jgi:hypothetical protein
MTGAPISDVLARMREIVAPLPRSDGVACFTRLYAEVTEGVRDGLAGVTFHDPRFLGHLDTVFAELFFEALATFLRDSGATPAAWLPLFDTRSRRGVAPLQFALAGMNAHINRDLPVALVRTCEELSLELAEGSPQHSDFERVNGVLATVEARVKREYLSGWVRAIDRLVHRADRLDDVVAMWNVSRARDAAWANAEALWALRGDKELTSRYLTTLDKMVGFAGRGLLVPADTWAARLARRLGF